MSHKKHKAGDRFRKLRSFYIWHRYIGLAAALFVIILSVTGLALNHTDRLSLASNYIKSEWLLGWYGIREPEETTLFRTGKHTLVHMDSRLYLDQRLIPGEFSKPLGLISFPHFIAIAIQGEIVLLSRGLLQAHLLQNSRQISIACTAAIFSHWNVSYSTCTVAGFWVNGALP